MIGRKKYLVEVVLLHLVGLYAAAASGGGGDAVLKVTLSDEGLVQEQPLEYPGYPGDAVPATNITWTLTGPLDRRILLNCTRISLPKRVGCSEGVLSVTDSRGRVNICTETKSYRRASIGNSVTVQFKTAAGARSKGRMDCVARLLEQSDEETSLLLLGRSDSGDKLTSCPCSRTNSENKKRVVGGKNAGKNEFSFMAYITDGFGLKLYCGGSIITERHILTAAHCLITNTYIPLQEVIVGINDIKKVKRSEWARTLSVEDLYRYPGYKSGEYKHDIGLILLSEDIQFNQFVGPVCLPTVSYSLIGQKVKVLGWGRSDNYCLLPPAPALRVVDVKVVPLTKCNVKTDLDHLLFCTYTRGKELISGDSGSPLLYMDPELGRLVQVGIHSSGDDSKKGYNVLLFHYFDWIQSRIDADSNRRKQAAARRNLTGTEGHFEGYNTCEKIEKPLH